jgi:hypothetical protein
MRTRRWPEGHRGPSPKFNGTRDNLPAQLVVIWRTVKRGLQPRYQAVYLIVVTRSLAPGGQQPATRGIKGGHDLVARTLSGADIPQFPVPATPFLDVNLATASERPELSQLVQKLHGPAEQFGHLVGSKSGQIVVVT